MTYEGRHGTEGANEEKAKVNELWEEAKRKNESRMEEEK